MTLKIPHASLCSDTEFLRRVSLDLTGRLPEPEKIREFVKDPDPHKREKLAEAIMATSTTGVVTRPSTAFLDRWAYFFCDLFHVNGLTGKGRTLFYHYIYDSLVVNKPYDHLVREILTTTTRSNFNSAPANFLVRFYVDQPDQTTVNPEDTYDEWAIRTTKMFLGIRDFHTNIYDKAQKWNHYNLSRELDSGLGELIGDLEKTQTRDGPSLLDQTLIVCMGEFGRTPGDITVNKGRNHHRFAMSGLFAGGGIAGGQAIGATDEQGAKVVKPGWSKKRSIYPEDVAATIYSALGIDWSKEITKTPSGRAFRYVERQSGTDFLDVGEISPVFG